MFEAKQLLASLIFPLVVVNYIYFGVVWIEILGLCFIYLLSLSLVIHPGDKSEPEDSSSDANPYDFDIVRNWVIEHTLGTLNDEHCFNSTCVDRQPGEGSDPVTELV